MEETNRYDIIIVGSGMGALTCAALMARVSHKRVLVLERHFVLGGYTHSFTRHGRHKWDVGLHYVGRMSRREMPRRVMDFITGGNLGWQRITDPFETFVYPGLTFDVTGDRKKYSQGLKNLFPHEARAIEAYFKDVKSAAGWFIRYYFSRFVPAPMAAALNFLNRLSRNPVLLTTREYLDKRFGDPRLRAVVASQWGDYGLPPSKSSFLIHAVVVNHFLQGGYYPEGGADEIATNIVPLIERHGGRCLTGREVSSVLIENNRAVGVRVNVKEGSTTAVHEYRAPVVVSGIGAYNTYTKLVPHDRIAHFREKLAAISDGSSSVTVYLALKRDAKSIGINGQNCWIYDGYDHDDHYSNSGIMRGKPTWCYLSFPSARNSRDDTHTATVIACVPYVAFEKWKEQDWRKRDKDYYELKESVAQGLITFVDKHYPGFKELVEYHELSTPLTSEFFTDHTDGAMYGLPGTPQRYRQDWLQVRTPVKGLFLTGSDISSVGVASSMMAGVATAALLNGPLGFVKLIRALRASERPGER